MRSNWNLTIRAEGDHHTQEEGADTSKNADVLIRAFIQKLRDSGHEVLIASFTPGDEDLSRSQ